MKPYKIYIHRKIENPYEDGTKIGAEIKRKIGKPSLMVFITSIFDEDTLKKSLMACKGMYLWMDLLDALLEERLLEIII
jgi:hypothetical protein